MARLGRSRPFPPVWIEAPQVGAVTPPTPSPSRASGVTVVSQATQSARTRRWGGSDAITRRPIFLKPAQDNFFTGSQTRPTGVQIVGQASNAARLRRWGGSDAITRRPIFITQAKDNFFTGSQTRATGIVTVLQAGNRALRKRLGRDDPFQARFISPPPVGAVGGAVVTVAPAQTIQIQVVGQATERARRRATLTEPTIWQPNPSTVSGPAGAVTVVLQATERARNRRGIALWQPRLWQPNPSTVSGPAGIITTVLQATRRASQRRLGERRPFAPKLWRGLSSPGSAPSSVVAVVGQAVSRALLRRRHTQAQFIVTNPALTPPPPSVGQPAGVYVTVVSEAVTRETTRRLGRGAPFPAKWIIPPPRGFAPPPVTETTGGGGDRPQYPRYIMHAVDPALAIGLADDDEEFAALLQLTRQRRTR